MIRIGCFSFLCAINAYSEAIEPIIHDAFTMAAPGTVQIDGWVGGKLEMCLTNRVMVQDIESLVKPFRDRTEPSGGWRCEYWGKWFTSAALGYSYQPTPEYRAVLDKAVHGLIATQTADGYIGTYGPKIQLGHWDIWGRKYVLLGLLADYDLTGDQAVLSSAARSADYLMKELTVSRINITETGLDVLKGLAPSSILEPIVLLYQRTGEKRYLEFAQSIVAQWGEKNKFYPHGLQLITKAIAGVPPLKIAVPKAYEMMSCFEGLCELYRMTGDQRFRDAAVAFANNIRVHERMVVGSGSNQELWCDGARCQTEIIEQPIETCVTATWMKLCAQMLRITGEPVWADELEISLYNALLGAMTPKGNWWSYWSPLNGQRVPSTFQQTDIALSCCVASGPRALLLTPRWAVMAAPEGPVINLYAPGTSTVALRDGTTVKIIQETDFPLGDRVALSISPTKKLHFPLRLRVPEWSKKTTITINDEPSVAGRPGTYAVLERDWSPGDHIAMTLDLRGRSIAAPSGAPQLALMRGPIVLALDDRMVKAQDTAVRLETDADGYIELKPSATKPNDIWMSFDVPFAVNPSHFFNHHKITLAMCDFSSAGNQWSDKNLYRVWLPQPLFLHDVYPEDTWKLMYPDAKSRPVIPSL